MKFILRKSILFALAIICAVPVFGVETASEVLARCASKIKQAPSVTLDFTLAYGDRSSDCRLIIARDKFRFSSADLEVWYDGATQWSYNTVSREVSITDPTDEELTEYNPFAILTGYSEQFTARRLSGDKNEIELVAKNKMSNIRKAVLTIDSKTDMPVKLVATLSNGRTFAAKVASATTGKALPSSVFVYNKDKFPAKTIVDLR